MWVTRLRWHEHQLILPVDVCKDINRWLSPSNVSDDLTKHLSEYMEGSCKWLTADPALEGLLTSPNSSVLRILARPGAGKTIAASFLIRYLAESGTGAVLYFFCKASDAEKRTTLPILRSLLWQCLQQGADLYSTVVQWYYQSGRSVADSQTDVGAMLNACLQSTALPAIFVVIDGFDECLDKTDLLQALSSAMAASQSILKLIMFSRDEVRLPNLPPSEVRTIHMTADQCQNSIEPYVKERLADINSLGRHRYDVQLAESIINAAEGLWLFARVLLDELHHAPSLGEVQRQIAGLPHGLRSLYTSILIAKENSFSDIQLKMAQELFLWIDTAEYLPEWAVPDEQTDCLEGETICTILGAAAASRQLLDPRQIVRHLASPLLEVRSISPTSSYDQHGIPYDCTTLAVDFLHQTVPQYLRLSVGAPSAELPQVLRPRRLASLHRGVTATCYLSRSHDFKDNLQQLRERPRDGIFPDYIEMVYGLWGALRLPHLRWDLEAEEAVKAGNLCDQLTQFLTTDQCLGWIEAAIIINYAGRWINLITNVEDVLEVDVDSFSSTPAFYRFHCARQALMVDFVYVLTSTWPKSDLPPQTANRVDNMPDGFYQRPLARKIMALARQYQWLLTPAHARSSNCFSINGRS
jgi:hypothetical protein